MRLAGIPIPNRDVLELARSLRDAGFDETAETLENAYDEKRTVVALTIPDCEAILRALDDPPAGLAALRGVLLRGTSGDSVKGLSRSAVPLRLEAPCLLIGGARCMQWS